MYVNNLVNKFQELEKWFASEHGLAVAKEFKAELSKIFRQYKVIPGNSVLQLGHCEFDFCEPLSFQSKWIITPFEHENTSLIAQYTRLPFERDSIDCIISPLIVDAFHYKSSLLNEFDRVLKPGGQLIFLGINPISFWGLWLSRAKSTCYGKFNTLPKAAFALRYLLTQRNYELSHHSNIYPLLPLKKQGYLSFLSIFSKFLSPLSCGFYCLVVQKFEDTLIPISSPRKQKKYQNIDPTLQPSCLRDNR